MNPTAKYSIGDVLVTRFTLGVVTAVTLTTDQSGNPVIQYSLGGAFRGTGQDYSPLEKDIIGKVAVQTS